MTFLLSKIVAVLTTVVAVLTFQQVQVSQTSTTPNPSQTALPSSSAPSKEIRTPVSTPKSTPDLSGLVQQINELQKQIANYTPEPIPTQQIIYVPQPTIVYLSSTPTSLITPEPTPTPTLETCTLSASRDGTVYWDSNVPDLEADGSLTPSAGQDGGKILWDRASYHVKGQSGSQKTDPNDLYSLQIGNAVCYTYFPSSSPVPAGQIAPPESPASLPGIPPDLHL